MTFTAQVKDDLTRVVCTRRCCRQAELAAFFRFGGNIHIGSRQSIALSMNTENAAVARRIFALSRSLGLKAELATHRRDRLKKNQVFSLVVRNNAQVEPLLATMGIMDASMVLNSDFPGRFNEHIISNDCCRRAFIRGAFLAGGSVSNPEGAYHLEIIARDQRLASLLQQLLAEFEINANITTRKDVYIVYLKSGEQISNMLNLMGSHRSLLEFESMRVDKEMRNHVNRLVNCEEANLDKTVAAAMRQIEMINHLQATKGLACLPPSLLEVAQLRLDHPDASLSELSEISHIGRSAINHRFRRLMNIAEGLHKGPYKTKKSE